MIEIVQSSVDVAMGSLLKEGMLGHDATVVGKLV